MNTEPTFQTKVNGKWILTGEHAVLRGCPAIIFPVFNKSLSLDYWSTKEEASASFSGEHSDELQCLFWGTLERAIEILNIQHSNLFGKFHINNNIPIGKGMGASAALCVAIGRWFVNKKVVPKEDLFEFARQLENLFHNESSGADIAVAIAGKGIYFSRSGGLHPIQPKWQPKWYLSYSDKQSTTAECVKKVKELWITAPKKAKKIDEEMEQSVAMAKEALSLPEENGFPLLVEAIKIGNNCFKQWGLTEGNLDRHIKELLESGAVAAKPTGSGQGGFVISLWEKDPQLGNAFLKM